MKNNRNKQTGSGPAKEEEESNSARQQRVRL